MSLVLNLGCGTDHHDDALNVDAVEACDPDEVRDITEYPWPWRDADEIRMYHVLEHLPDTEHALREAADTLRPGGELEVKVPVGLDARADPDHDWGGSQPWTWRTPEFYCGARHWDTDVGLVIDDRDVELWSVQPSGWRKALDRARWQYKLSTYGPGEWCFSEAAACGEYTVRFRKPAPATEGEEA